MTTVPINVTLDLSHDVCVLAVGSWAMFAIFARLVTAAVIAYLGYRFVVPIGEAIAARIRRGKKGVRR